MKIGAKMATQQDENRKKTKMDPKNVFFSKIPHFFELLKPVPESPYQTVFWPECIYRNINFVLKCLPMQCVLFLVIVDFNKNTKYGYRHKNKTQNSYKTFSTILYFCCSENISPLPWNFHPVAIFVCVYSDILLIQFHPPETLRSAGWICEDDSDHSRAP